MVLTAADPIQSANAGNAAPEWLQAAGPVPYDEAVTFMAKRAALIREGQANEMIWLLEHAPLYTAGTSAKSADLLLPQRFPVHASGRGGQYTYHGPGQRIAYVMLDLGRRGRDVRHFVRLLEEWLIQTLAGFGIKGERREGRVGIWVIDRAGHEAKIAALGVRLRHWVSFHGVSLNVNPDLSHYDGIVPCGLGAYGVTSMAAQGLKVDMHDVDEALRIAFGRVF